MVARWTTGQQVELSVLSQGHKFITNFISFAAVVPGPVKPYSAESWPKTPAISFHHIHNYTGMRDSNRRVPECHVIFGTLPDVRRLEMERSEFLENEA